MKSAFSQRNWLKACTGLLALAPVWLNANIPIIRQLEVEFTPPANTAFKVETSPDLVTWTRSPEILFGRGQAQPVSIPLEEGARGYVRLALLGQPVLPPAPWALAPAVWNTYSQSQGSSGHLSIFNNQQCKLEMETTGQQPVQNFSFLRTSLTEGSLTTTAAPGAAHAEVSLNWATPNLGYYCQTTVNPDHSVTESRCGCFSLTTLAQIPSSVTGHNLAFSQNGAQQTLLHNSTSPTGWTLKYGTQSLSPAVTYSLEGATATLQVNLGPNQIDEYTLSFTEVNGGSCVRKIFRNGMAIETLKGSFAVE